MIEGGDIHSDICDEYTFGGTGVLRLVIDNFFESAKDVFPVYPSLKRARKSWVRLCGSMNGSTSSAVRSR